MKSSLTISTLTVAIAATPALAQDDHGHAGDFVVATDGMGNLAYEGGELDEPISNFIENGPGLFNGYFSNEPGFTNLDEDELDEGLFIVPDGTVIGFRLLSVDPAFAVYNPSFDTRLNNGDSFILGTVLRNPDGSIISGFDDHPWWTVETDSPDFDANILSYNMSFELFDARADGNALASTGPINVTFSRVPAPATLSVLGLAAFARRRR